MFRKKGNQMDLDHFSVQSEEEEQETLEQVTKRPCIKEDRAHSLDEEKIVEDKATTERAPSLDEEKVVEEEEEEETEDDTECVYLPPRRFMTNEEYLVYLRQVNESQGFDVQRFEGRLPGTIKPFPLNEFNCLPLIDFSKQAMQVYNESNKTSFEFYNLVKANFKVLLAQCSTLLLRRNLAIYLKYIETFRAKVWKKVQGVQVMSCEKHVL